MSDPVRITVDDVRSAGYCPLAIREFCGLHDIDLRSFVLHGTPYEEVRHIQDSNFSRVVAAAADREAREVE